MTTALAPVTRWWATVTRADRRAVAWLVALPTLLFVLPALAGHPAIVADNLIQNFPLRALAGRQLAGGHLPLMNPFADSGTPLLGGLNAGALYPTTLFFLVPLADRGVDRQPDRRLRRGRAGRLRPRALSRARAFAPRSWAR